MKKPNPKKAVKKKLSAKARIQDVPNAWYHSLKGRVEDLEKQMSEIRAEDCLYPEKQIRIKK